VTAEAIRSNYPASSFSTPTRAYATAYGDYRFFCGMMADAQKIAEYVPQSWTYQFAQQDPPVFTPDADSNVWPGAFTPVIGPWGDFHSADNQYWFDLLRPADRSPTNVALSTTMRAYFTNFARTGDPNGPGLPVWTPVASSPRTVLNLATPLQPNFDAFAEHRCGFWETVPPSDRLL
jgi:para-nitrobenzyl esterase